MKTVSSGKRRVAGGGGRYWGLSGLGTGIGAVTSGEQGRRQGFFPMPSDARRGHGFRLQSADFGCRPKERRAGQPKSLDRGRDEKPPAYCTVSVRFVVWLMPLAVPVTARVYIPAGVPVGVGVGVGVELLPPPPHAAHSTTRNSNDARVA